jgi:hypothetical protein
MNNPVIIVPKPIVLTPKIKKKEKGSEFNGG